VVGREIRPVRHVPMGWDPGMRSESRADQISEVGEEKASNRDEDRARSRWRIQRNHGHRWGR